MSDSNRTAVAFAIESTAGTAAAGPYQALNISSVNLASQKNTAEENTIRPDRNLRGLIMTSLLPTGGFGFDMIFGNLDGLILGMMGQAAWSTPVSLTGTSVTITGSTITASTGTPFSVVVPGQWLKIVIGTTVYLVKVTTVGGAGANITVTGATLPTGAQTLASVKGKFIRNGTTLQTYTLETSAQDEATKGFFQFLGCVPNTWSIQAQAEQIVTGNMDFMGMSAPPPTTASASGAAYTAAVSNESFAGLAGNIGSIFLGSTLVDATSVAVKGLNFSATNNVRRDAGINVARMGWGQFTVTGQASTFFKGGLAAVDAYFTHSDVGLSYAMIDPAGNIMVLTWPRTKLSNFQKQAGGKNQAVMGDLDFTAVVDTTIGGFTMQVDLIAVP
jgi:hypothetical protein